MLWQSILSDRCSAIKTIFFLAFSHMSNKLAVAITQQTPDTNFAQIVFAYSVKKHRTIEMTWGETTKPANGKKTT